MNARGKLWDCTLADYLAEHDRWGSGAISTYVTDGPQAAMEAWLGRAPERDSKALRVGGLTHEATFEPDHFKRWVVKDWNGATTKGKERAAEVKKSGRPIADAKEHALAVAMSSAIRRAAAEQLEAGEPFLAEVLVSAGLIEQGVTWEDEETGLALKGRWDKAIPRARVVLELKTSKEWRPEQWAREAHKLGYHRQAWMYRDAFEAVFGEVPRLVHVVVHNMYPHEVALYEMPDLVLELGRDECRRAMTEIVERMQSSRWRAPEQVGVSTLTYPHWVFQDEEMAEATRGKPITIGGKSLF